MSKTPSSDLAAAIFPARLPTPSAEAWRALRVPPFPPAFLAFLGVVLLVAGLGTDTESADRVTLSLGLILAALVWVALMLLAELLAPAPRASGEER